MAREISVYYCPECEREIEGPPEIAETARCPVDGTELYQLPKGLTPGVVIDDRYTIVKPLGKGGMGMVFEVEDQTENERVAIKLIHAVGDNELAVRRFFREATASTRIVHPGVVEVYDFGQTSEGKPYMVMEILGGEPLDDILRKEGPLDARRAVHISAEIASALVPSHALQILHRDLKPSNIMVRCVDGVERAKVLDFGLAKAVEDDTGELGTVTATGMLVGTPQYMSPEQFRCHDLGPPTDFYSLGVLLYEMLTGTLPFQGSNVFSLMQGHVMQDPLPPSEAASGIEIPPKIEAFCLQLLEKEPEKRAVDTESLARQLRSLAGEYGGPQHTDFVDDERRPPKEAEFATPTVVSSASNPAEVLESAQPRRFRPELVGRERTRRFLDGILDSCVDSAKPAVISLEGPGGMGKSMLIDWYRRQAELSGVRVVQGIYSEGHLGPLGALKDALEELLGVAHESWEAIETGLETIAVQRRDDEDRLSADQLDRLRQFLRPQLDESEDQVEFAREDRENFYETLLRVLRWAAGDEPTMVVLDELREDRPFDPLFTARLGAQLAETEQPLLLILAVCTGDTTPSDAPAEKLDETVVSSLAVELREQFYRIELGPLDTEESQILARRALPGISAEAAVRIAEFGDGNPLLCLQLLRNMVAEATLQRRGQEWELVGEPSLPEDLSGVLDARLRRLRGTDCEEEVLIRAALIGRRLPLDLLVTVLEREGNFALLDDLDDLIDRLVADGWLRNAESRDEKTILFEHRFLREAIEGRYGSKRAARKIHGHIAEALETYYAEQLEPVASRIADHFLASRNHERALPYLIEAARAAEARYCMDEAVDAWRRAAKSLRRARADEETSDRVQRGLDRASQHLFEKEQATPQSAG